MSLCCLSQRSPLGSGSGGCSGGSRCLGTQRSKFSTSPCSAAAAKLSSTPDDDEDDDDEDDDDEDDEEDDEESAEESADDGDCEGAMAA